MATAATLPLGWWAALELGPSRPRELAAGAGLPTAWRLPIPRNPEFVGREDVLTKLEEQLHEIGTTTIQALHGMGGVGKTQVASEYAHRHADHYRIVWWVTSEEGPLIEEQIAALAVVLGLANLGEGASLAAARAAAHLRERNDWLLIFDNADNPGDLGPWLPSGRGHTIITSRVPLWSQFGSTIAIGEMPRRESIALLRNGLPRLSYEEADHVADTLSDLPLALVQAAGFMASTGVTAADYLSMVANEPLLTLDQGPSGSHQNRLTATVALSVDRLSGLQPAAISLLNVCSVLAPEPIPTKWLTECASTIVGPVTSARESETAITVLRGIELIKNLGLATTTQDGIQMHRLTRSLVAAGMDDARRSRAREIAEALLSAQEPADTDNPSTWPSWARILPHLLAIDPATAHDPNLLRLACNSVRYLLRRGAVSVGHQLADSIFQSWRDRFGPDDDHTLAAANQLAHSFELVGRFDRALEVAEDALARRRRLLGDDDPATLLVAGRAAVYLYHLGDYEVARQLNEATLARRRRVLGDDHPDTIRTAANLASCLREIGDHEQAFTLDEDAFDRRLRILGMDHPDTLGSANSRAFNLRHKGDFAAARALDAEIYARRCRVLGEDHLETLDAGTNLALDLRIAGMHEEAHKLNMDVATRLRRVFGDDHPQTLRTVMDLAINLYSIGRHDEARQLGDDTLCRLHTVLGAQHPRTKSAAAELALLRCV